jgi:hypothetical protein
MGSIVSLFILIADKVEGAREIGRGSSQTARRENEGSCRQIENPSKLDTAVVNRGQRFVSRNAGFLEHTLA